MNTSRRMAELCSTWKITCVKLKIVELHFLWDSKSIQGHMKRKHDNLPMEEYKDKYMGTYVDTGIVKEEKIKKYVPTSNISWANKCIFECVICPTPTQHNAKSKFHKHTSSVHGITPKEYITKYGSTKSQVENHTCQVEGCGSNLFWEQSAIYKRLSAIRELYTEARSKAH